MSDSDPTHNPTPDAEAAQASSGHDASPPAASGSANQSRITTLREEVKGIDDKLGLSTLDLQTKMEMKARKQMLERQIRDIEKKGS